jgi:hypothetical protein
MFSRKTAWGVCVEVCIPSMIFRTLCEDKEVSVFHANYDICKDEFIYLLELMRLSAMHGFFRWPKISMRT